jgi:hypothetical protein
MFTTLLSSYVEPYCFPSATVTASSIASESAPCQAFEPTPLQPLVVVAEACCLLGTSVIAGDIENSRFKAETTLQRSLLVSQQQLLACAKTKFPEPISKVGQLSEPLVKPPGPFAGTIEDANASSLLDFHLVMDFFDSQSADVETKAGLYRCAMGNRLSIQDKLAMMQHAISSAHVICGLSFESLTPFTVLSQSRKPFSAGSATNTNLPSFIREHAYILSQYLLRNFDAIQEYELQLNAKDISYKQWCPKFQLFVFAASESFGQRLLTEIASQASTRHTRCATTTASRRSLKQRRMKLPLLESEINRLRTILHVVGKSRRRWKKAFEKRRNR